MDKIGYIEIKISGSKGNLNLTPDNYDIREIISILENAENLLFPTDKRERPTISYKIEEGSVKHTTNHNTNTFYNNSIWSNKYG